MMSWSIAYECTKDVRFRASGYEIAAYRNEVNIKKCYLPTSIIFGSNLANLPNILLPLLEA